RAQPPTIDDVPKGESPKQALIWLMQKGSLSKKEAQAAATLMTKFAEVGRPVTSRNGLRDVLLLIGAARALPPGELEAFEKARAKVEANARRGGVREARAKAEANARAPQQPQDSQGPPPPQDPPALQPFPPPQAPETPEAPE